MNDTTLLTLDVQRLVLRGDGVGEVVATLGIDTVVAHFRHAPPTGAELERAIDAIEDALMARRLGHADRGTLATSSASLRSLPGLASNGAVLSLDQVESLFQRLADASSGPPTALGGLPADRETAAALLILRETMHHLGFDRVQMLAAD
jgi:exopolyphosphatase/pppGpp-phosphohydrolase